MILQELTKPALSELLTTTGISLDTGTFKTHLRTDVEELVEEISAQYGAFPVESEPAICDFFLQISPPSLLRRLVRKNVRAMVDDKDLFEPMRRDLAYPLLESALNWCIATDISRYLLMHSAVMARDGKAVIFPAPSGSGKSTLCAYLFLAGWRLLSDEFAILRTDDGKILGNPRPVSLKNESIERIGEACEAGQLSRRFEGTIKGTVAFLRPSGPTIAELKEPCTPTLIVFPSFQRGAALSLKPVENAEGFMRLIDNAVNYLTLGEASFTCLSEMVQRCPIYQLEYGKIEDAIAALEEQLEVAASSVEGAES